MRVKTQLPRLFREDSEETIHISSTEDEDDSLDKSSSRSVSTVENTPPASLPGVVGNSKNHQSGMPSRRISASQPLQSSRSLHPRHEIEPALRRASSVIQPSSSTDSIVSIKISPGDTSRKVSAKRKLEGPEDGPRVRKKLPSPLGSSEKSESASPSPSEPLPGRTSDGKIDYQYYVSKYLNQRHSRIK